VRPEDISVKNLNHPTVNQTRDLPPVAQCLNQLRHRVPTVFLSAILIFLKLERGCPLEGCLVLFIRTAERIPNITTMPGASLHVCHFDILTQLIIDCDVVQFGT
jgi:hypothetical protein